MDQKKKNIVIFDIRLETTEKCSCISRRPSRNEGIGFQKLWQMLHSKWKTLTEVSDGEKKALQKH